MLLAYPAYYKKYGVRKAFQLANTVISSIDELHFPRNSLFHFLGKDATTLDPDSKNIYFQGYGTKKFLIDFVKEIDSNKGTPRKRSPNLQSLIRPFLHNNIKSFRYVKNNYETCTDLYTLLIMNYSYISKFYIYPKTRLTEYNKWTNIENTCWNRVNKIAEKTERNQFFFYEIDSMLPSWSSLRFFSKKESPALIKIFNTDTKLFILDLFRWLDRSTRSSSLLGHIEKDNLDKVNIVFLFKSKWFILNLNYLDQWLLEDDREKIPGVMSYSSLVMQKLFLKSLINLVSHTVEDTPVDTLIDIPNDNTSDSRNNEVVSDSNSNDSDETELSKAISNDYVSNDRNESKVSHYFKIAKAVNNEIDNSTAIDFENMDLILSDIDKDLKELDSMHDLYLKERNISVNDTEDDTENESTKIKLTKEEIITKLINPVSPEDTLYKDIDEYATYGVLSAADYKKLKNASREFINIQDPYTPGKLLKDTSVITRDLIDINEGNNIIIENINLEDKSFNKSSLRNFDKQYLNNVLKKDILNSVKGIQKAGVIIQDYSLEENISILGSSETHTLKIRPIDGKSSIVRFKIPKIDNNGIFVENGNKYILRKQRTDLPIRKIKPTIVALSSYYGKTFIERSIFERMSAEAWVSKKLEKASLVEGTDIQKLYPGYVYDNYFTAPYMYNALATQFKSIVFKNFTLVFDHRWRNEQFNPKDLADLEKDNLILFGLTKNKLPILISSSNEIFVYKDSTYENIGDIYSLLQLDISDLPIDYATIRIFSKKIPIGLILAYYLGLDNLLTLLNTKYRLDTSVRSAKLDSHEWLLKFKDSVLVISKNDYLSSIIIGGLKVYSDTISEYDYNVFNSKEIYFTLLESVNLNSIYIREIDSTDRLFIDPITEEILSEMKEPTTFRGLLIRACEMLLNYQYPDFQDMTAMRIRGYERIAGAIYKELAHGARNYRSKTIRGKAQIDINPYAVWKNIRGDNAIKIIEDINPIQNIKESEAVTYVGEGGRTRDSLSKPTRAYHPTDMGIISESTIDSGDVGINTYLSANPKFKNIRGLPSFTEEITNSNLLSTSALLSPGADHDDPARVNFISIQQSHTIGIETYTQPYLQTGYEQIMPFRTSDLFAYMAEDNGIVVDKNDIAVFLEYKTLGRKGVTLGRRFGKAEGSIYPHDIICDLKINDKFSKGDPIAYNNNFFEKDFYDSKRLLYKGSINVKTAIYDTGQTLEDASSVSKEISRKMQANITKVKTYIVEFKQGIRRMVPLKSIVKPGDVLFYIENETTANTDLFDDESLHMLKRLSNQSPKTRDEGIIDRIETFYHGSKDDMSHSLKQLVTETDKQLRIQEQAMGPDSKQLSGNVDQEYRTGGVSLPLDTVEIKIYITIQDKLGIGDKGVFANQMKSVISEIMENDMHTEAGDKIDAVFGYRSISARVVLSPLVIGTTTSLLKVIAEKAIETYEA